MIVNAMEGHKDTGLWEMSFVPMDQLAEHQHLWASVPRMHTESGGPGGVKAWTIHYESFRH
jgi:hypothetical protein